VTGGAPAEPAESDAFRCAAASEALSEPLAGTASTVRSFLLIEDPGPWGVDAVRDSRLPEEVKQRLTDLEGRHRIRPLLIRRHRAARRARPVRSAGPPQGGTRVFAAHVAGDEPWVETALLDHVRDIVDLDVEGLALGRRAGLARHDGPLFLVCTHGRHDACCAERGRPLAAALSEAAPDRTWEVSHVGGDRFAANVLVLPHGLYYGRLLPGAAAELARRHLSGELDLEHLRGRSAYPFPVQAAEVYLRRHLGDTSVEPFLVEEHARQGSESRVVLAVAGRRWEVRVHAGHGDPRQLTCRATRTSAGRRHELVGLTAL
jgi:hypothetical protein